jgi:hypothetical protein
MGLLKGLFGLPLLPVWGTIAIAEQLLEQAEQEYYDPVLIRRKLEELDRLREQGSVPAEEAEAIEDELIDRMLTGRQRGIGSGGMT